MDSDLDNKTADGIEKTTQTALRSIQTGLSFRIDGLDVDATARARSEHMVDKMIEAANLATEAEEITVALMIIAEFLNNGWDVAVSNTPFPRVKYMTKMERLAPVIRAYPVLHETRGRVNQTLDAAQRCVDRLTHMHGVASRAAGLSYGPQ